MAYGITKKTLLTLSITRKSLLKRLDLHSSLQAQVISFSVTVLLEHLGRKYFCIPVCKIVCHPSGQTQPHLNRWQTVCVCVCVCVWAVVCVGGCVCVCVCVCVFK